MNKGRSPSSPDDAGSGLAGDNLPQAVRDFLGKYIRSIEQLDILLLVSARGNLSWTASQVYDVILSSESSVARWLEELVGDGLIERVDEGAPLYRKATDAQVEAQISALRRTYKTAPSRTIEAIYKRDIEAVQKFADAFKLKDTPQK